MTADKQICFVVQGFGEKTDFETGRVLNLDASYEVINEAVTDAGLTCIRADEIQHSAVIDVPMYKYLLEADLVIADLSTSNVNAAYELGVRHALLKRPTIIVAEQQWKMAFDVNRNSILFYEHLGPDLGRKAAKDFSKQLTEKIESVMSSDMVDSPLYTYIDNLLPPALSDQPSSRSGAEVDEESVKSDQSQSLKTIKDLAIKAKDDGDLIKAKTYFSDARELSPNDKYIIQQLALCTYKSKQPTEQEALIEAKELIEKELNPDGSTDPETLGLWAAVHKRLWTLNQDKQSLEQAISALERGFLLKHDYYNGINLAYMLDERANTLPSDSEEAIADRVQARRVRSKVMPIAESELKLDINDDERKYWITATLWEAAEGLNDKKQISKWKKKTKDFAKKKNLQDWMVESTTNQIKTLRSLL